MDSAMKGLMGQCPLPQNFWTRTACQHTCATKTFLTTVSGVNLRRHIGFNVASGAQSDSLINCAIEIFLLN